MHLHASVMDCIHYKVNRAGMTCLGRQDKRDELGSVNCGWHYVRIDCDPMAAAAVHDVENAIITHDDLVHLRIQVFVPVVALKGSKDFCVKEEPGDDPYRCCQNRGTHS